MTQTDKNHHPIAQEFGLDYNRKTIPIYRWGLVIAVVLFMLFYVLDIYAIPDALFVSGIIRFVLTPVLLGPLIAFSFWKGYVEYHQPALAAASLIANILLLAIILSSHSPDRYLYYAALALVGLFLAYIMRPRTLWQIFVSLLVTGAALVMLLTAEFSFVAKLTMALYLVASALVEIIGCRLMEQFYWNDFMLNREVANARDRAEQATRLKDKYISLVSHDLKGPISAIRGFMYLSQNTSLSTEEMREYAMNSSKCADALLKTIDSLLGIDRLGSEELSPVSRPFDVSALAGEMIMNLKYLADAKSIAVRNEIPQEAKLNGDRVLIGQVLLNLIGNAIKFTPPGGTVTIFIQDGRTIGVRDTGSGISPDILPHLFSHNLRTTGVGTSGEKGTGLGLPLSYDIIKAHQGSLRVASGLAGTTMYIELPG